MAISLVLPEFGAKGLTTKDTVLSILSVEWPLASNRIHRLVVKKLDRAVSYQAVHKVLKQMVENKVLEKRGKGYLIDVHWLNHLESFVKEIRELYGLGYDAVEGVGRQTFFGGDLFSPNLSYLNHFKKKLVEKLREEIENVEAFEIQEILLNDFSLKEKLDKKVVMQTVDELISSFKSPRRHIKWGAILALKEFGNKGAAIKKLSKQLNCSEDAFVRGYAALALGAIGGESALNALIKRLGRERNDRVLRRVLDMLGLFKGNRSIRVLSSFLKRKDKHLRYHALIALTKIDLQKSKEIVLKYLHSNDPIMRVEAAFGLKNNFGEETALIKSILSNDAKHLLELLKIKDYVIQTHCILALGKTKSKSAVKPLIEFLNDKRNIGRWFAVIALSKIGSRKAIKPIVDFLKEPDNEYKYFAAVALSRLGREKTMKFLQPLFSHPDEEIRRFALEATIPIEKKFLLTDFV